MRTALCDFTVKARKENFSFHIKIWIKITRSHVQRQTHWSKCIAIDTKTAGRQRGDQVKAGRRKVTEVSTKYYINPILAAAFDAGNFALLPVFASVCVWQWINREADRFVYGTNFQKPNDATMLYYRNKLKEEKCKKLILHLQRLQV